MSADAFKTWQWKQQMDAFEAMFEKLGKRVDSLRSLLERIAATSSSASPPAADEHPYRETATASGHEKMTGFDNSGLPCPDDCRWCGLRRKFWNANEACRGRK